MKSHKAKTSSDDLTRAYRYTHLVTSSHPELFWGQAYKAAGAANRIIEVIKDDASEDLNQLKGENLYIRAMMHFNLVRIFGRPYSQGSGNNPGVPILKDGLRTRLRATLPRSTVKEVYDFVIADLLKAAELMRADRKGRPIPLLRKKWLMRCYQGCICTKKTMPKSIEYADKVINAGR